MARRSSLPHSSAAGLRQCAPPQFSPISVPIACMVSARIAASAAARRRHQVRTACTVWCALKVAFRWQAWRGMGAGRCKAWLVAPAMILATPALHRTCFAARRTSSAARTSRRCARRRACCERRPWVVAGSSFVHILPPPLYPSIQNPSLPPPPTRPTINFKPSPPMGGPSPALSGHSYLSCGHRLDPPPPRGGRRPRSVGCRWVPLMGGLVP